MVFVFGGELAMKVEGNFDILQCVSVAMSCEYVPEVNGLCAYNACGDSLVEGPGNHRGRGLLWLRLFLFTFTSGAEDAVYISRHNPHHGERSFTYSKAKHKSL